PTAPDLQVGRQAQRPVPDVLVLAALHPSRPHRDVRVFPLQRLDAGLLVRADDVDALFGKTSGPSVQVTDRLGLFAEYLRVNRVGIQPVAAAMRLQVGLPLKNAPRFVRRWSGRSCASGPRRLTPEPSSG